MMKPDDFRRLALGMPGATEGAHMGHPDFRAANGRIFASLHSEDTVGMVALQPEEQEELIRTNPEMFRPSSGAWGQKGYTDVVLQKARKPVVRGAVFLAWQTTADKPRARTSTPRPKTSPARKRTG